MSIIFSEKPNFINLYDVDLKTLEYFEKDKLLYKLKMCFRAFVPNGNGDINDHYISSNAAVIGDEACSQFLKYLTKKVAEIALKCELSNVHECEIDIKKDLWMSTEAQKVLIQFNCLNMQQPNTKKPIIERLTNVIKLTFLTVGCKGEQIELEDTYKLRLSWNKGNIFKPKYKLASPYKNQFESLNDMRKNNEFVDCIIEVEGQSIPVHRCILAAKSSVFKAMLTLPVKESIEKKIRFPNEKLNIINLFLDYIYQGFVIIDDMKLDDILALTRLAHQYEINDLFNACRSLLYEQLISAENIIEVYLLAQELDSKPLMTICELYATRIPDLTIDVSAITDFDHLTKIYQVAQKLELKGYMASIEKEIKTK